MLAYNVDESAVTLNIPGLDGFPALSIVLTLYKPLKLADEDTIIDDCSYEYVPPLIRSAPRRQDFNDGLIDGHRREALIVLRRDALRTKNCCH